MSEIFTIKINTYQLGLANTTVQVQNVKLIFCVNDDDDQKTPNFKENEKKFHEHTISRKTLLCKRFSRNS